MRISVGFKLRLPRLNCRKRHTGHRWLRYVVVRGEDWGMSYMEMFHRFDKLFRRSRCVGRGVFERLSFEISGQMSDGSSAVDQEKVEFLLSSCVFVAASTSSHLSDQVFV